MRHIISVLSCESRLKRNRIVMGRHLPAPVEVYGLPSLTSRVYCGFSLCAPSLAMLISLTLQHLVLERTCPSHTLCRPAFTMFLNQRDDIPSSVSGADDTIDISSWGAPTAYWPSTSCDISQYFGPQQLILDHPVSTGISVQARIDSHTRRSVGSWLVRRSWRTKWGHGSGLGRCPSVRTIVVLIL